MDGVKDRCLVLPTMRLRTEGVGGMKHFHREQMLQYSDPRNRQNYPFIKFPSNFEYLLQVTAILRCLSLVCLSGRCSCAKFSLPHAVLKGWKLNPNCGP